MNIRYILTRNINREYVITDMSDGSSYIAADRAAANEKLTYIAANELCNVYHSENENAATLAVIA